MYIRLTAFVGLMLQYRSEISQDQSNLSANLQNSKRCICYCFQKVMNYDNSNKIFFPVNINSFVAFRFRLNLLVWKISCGENFIFCYCFCELKYRNLNRLFFHFYRDCFSIRRSMLFCLNYCSFELLDVWFYVSMFKQL